ncbi:chymotrypsin inhibitor-like protein, partial [Leptotrombidium deliense]
NQLYDNCGTSCPKTCLNINKINTICTANCVAGCRCMDGFVLNGTDCILPKQCPPQNPRLNPEPHLKLNEMRQQLWEEPSRMFPIEWSSMEPQWEESSRMFPIEWSSMEPPENPF